MFLAIFSFLSGCSFFSSPIGLAIQQEIAEEVVEYIVEELEELDDIEHIEQEKENGAD